MTQFGVEASVEAIKVLGKILRENPGEVDRVDRAQKARDAVRAARDAIMAVVMENPSKQIHAETASTQADTADVLYDMIDR